MNKTALNSQKEKHSIMMQLCEISIHALLAESDGGFAVGSWRLVIFLYYNGIYGWVSDEYLATTIYSSSK